MKACLGLALMVLLAGSASACTCPSRPDPLVALAQADIVFAGAVVDQEQADSTSKCYTLLVEEVWKGEVPDRVKVRTAGVGKPCGFPFRLSNRYLVYARADSVGYHTGICDRTRTYTGATEDLATFKRLGVNPRRGDVDSLVVSFLVQRLHQGDRLTKLGAAERLGKIARRPELSVPPLVTLWENGVVDEREAAMRALGQLGRSASMAWPYVVAATRDVDENVRAAAVRAIDDVAPVPDSAVTVLILSLTDPRPRIRTIAAEQLGGMKSLAADALADLAASLQDEVPIVREAAVRAMVDLEPDPDEIIPLLIEMRHDASDEVRRMVFWALAQVGPRAQGRQGEVIGALADALGDPSVAVRRRAADVLGEFREDAAIVLPQLIGALSDENLGVQRAVVRALGEIGPAAAAAAPALRRIAEDSSSRARREATRALERIEP